MALAVVGLTACSAASEPPVASQPTGVSPPGVSPPDGESPGVSQPAVSQPDEGLPGVSEPGVSLPDEGSPGVSQPDGVSPGSEAGDDGRSGDDGDEGARDEGDGGVVPEGFGTAAYRVVPPGDGTPCDVCLWVADDGPSRGRGLMEVTDLGGRDGMAFVYDTPTTVRFTMRNTVMPLSIVFYDIDGEYLDAFDMTPCRAEPCPTYPTPAGFTVAIEVPLGGAESLAMVPGSTLEFLGPDCDVVGV